MPDKKEIVLAWIKKGEEDLAIAKLTFQHLPELSDSVCYLAHQATEKFLKALLIHLDIQSPRSHNLLLLVDLINTKYQLDETCIKHCTFLNEYASELRYPFARYKPDSEKANLFIQYSGEVAAYVRSVIGSFKNQS